MATVFSIGLGACGNAETTSTKATKQEENKVSTSTKQDKQTITYLNNKYTVPKNVTKIATASLESMEDAAVLGVKPVGAVTVGGKSLNI
jgi:iron complex transport system substrate-binding protein